MPDAADDTLLPPAGWRGARLVDGIVLAVVAVLAVGFRFVTTSPLWLDEALSVNISALPLGDVPEALRHDGHPPLYYALLHGWMRVFGQGDVAVRALSAMFALALFPLMWVAGRRLAGRRGGFCAVAALALSPYAIRYATETRMYALVMVLALAAWLVADDALHHGATWPRLAGLALLAAALLYTHYWAAWYLAAAGVGLLVHLWRARKAGRTADVSATTRVLGALVAGVLLFLPWVPSLLEQLAHTGTPWAPPLRPTEVIATSVIDLGGGPAGEGVMLALLLALLVAVAAFGRGVDAVHVHLDLRTRPEPRPLLVVVGVGMLIGSAVGFLSGSAYATRYLAVFVPAILLLVGLGVTRFRGAVAFRVVLAGLFALGAIGGVRNVITDRTQAGVVADAIAARDPRGDLVLTCPDQLGPGLHRALEGAGLDTTGPRFEALEYDVEVATYPEFGDPRFVDWVDYTDRLAAVDPVAFAEEALDRAGDRTMWLVWSGTYRTHQGTCEAVLNRLLGDRPWAENVVVDDGEEFFEHMSAWRIPATEGG